jgi:hypothetical protein
MDPETVIASAKKMLAPDIIYGFGMAPNTSNMLFADETPTSGEASDISYSSNSSALIWILVIGVILWSVK